MTVAKLRRVYDPECTLCPLYEFATHVCVPSSGKKSLYSAMIVGEAPGRQEDALNTPFVGRAGWLLDRELLRHEITRDSIVVTNAVKCRPPQNATPSLMEISVCSNAFLREEIERLDPRYLLALGNAAASALLGRSGVVSLRGSWHEEQERHILVTYHPAYVWRNGLDSDIAEQFREDLSDFVWRIDADRPS